MNLSSSIQDFQLLQALTAVVAGAATMILAFAGRWIGGVWTNLLAIAASIVLAYQPLLHKALFSNLKNDRLQMIVVGLIPFALILIALSFRKVPLALHVLFALIGPALVLLCVFYDYTKVPLSTRFLHDIVPVCLAIFVCWCLLEPIASRSSTFAVPMVIGVLACASTFLLMLSKEQNAGLISTPVSGTAAGAALAAIGSAFIGKRQLSSARGPTLLWLTILGFMFGFLWISDGILPYKNLYWLASIPLLAWIPELGPFRKLKPWNRELIRLLLILIPAAISMTLAFKDHKREATESGDEYGLLDIQPAAPIFPSQMPIPNTISPPTIT